MLLSLFNRSTWSDPLCQEQCVYFASLSGVIHDNKWSVVDSRTFEGYYVYLRKALWSCSFRGAYLFYRTSCSSFCSKFTVLIKCMKTLAVILFLHGECVNVANSHLQLQLFINYSKNFRREIVDICSCKGDYWNSWLSPKNCSFGVLNLALTFFDNDVDYNDELFLWCVRPTKDV